MKTQTQILQSEASPLRCKKRPDGRHNNVLPAWLQMRTYLVALFLSQGVPVLTMGDEYGHTKNGNLDVEDRWGHRTADPPRISCQTAALQGGSL